MRDQRTRLWFLVCCWALLISARSAAAGALTGTVRLPGGKRAEDAVVYLARAPGRGAPPGQPVVMSQTRLRFSPRVLAVVKGQRVAFVNQDQVRHDLFSLSKPHRFSLGPLVPGSRREETFERAGVVTVLCNAYPDMSGFIVVLDNPFFFKTGPDGRFDIKDVPPGQYEVVAWRDGSSVTRQRVEVPATGGVEIAFQMD